MIRATHVWDVVKNEINLTYYDFDDRKCLSLITSSAVNQLCYEELMVRFANKMDSRRSDFDLLNIIKFSIIKYYYEIVKLNLVGRKIKT